LLKPDIYRPEVPRRSVRFKLFNGARVDEKENEPTSTDWKALY
jgi:hypothetical protein